MLRVRDIMTRAVTSLSPDASLETAAWQLTADRVSGAPVRDRAGNVIGMLTKSDLVEQVRDSPGESVGDVMTPAVWAVRSSDPALEAVQLMLDKGIHRVVVVDRPGQIAGILTTVDVMRALVRGAQFHSGARSWDTEEEGAEEEEEVAV